MEASNRDEAERCALLGLEALKEGNIARATRLSAKATRLAPEDAPETLKKLTASLAGRPPPPAEVNPESVEAVKRICKCSDYYEVLEVTKQSTEEEIKRAYRKLSLKVHPDKNKAPGAEEAFKAVSKAFQCLSDADARAGYDRGDREGTQERYHRRQQHGNRHGGVSPFFADDAFDPNEVFNAFFGMHGLRHMNGRVYRADFGNRGPGNRVNAGTSVGPSVLGLLQLLPLLFIFLYALMPPSESLYSLQRIEPYVLERRTNDLGVRFFVQSEDFDTKHPPNSRQRHRIDYQVESTYRESVSIRCHNERVQQSKLYRWGQVQKAKEMSMPNCMELNRLQRAY